MFKKERRAVIEAIAFTSTYRLSRAIKVGCDASWLNATILSFTTLCDDPSIMATNQLVQSKESVKKWEDYVEK